MPFVFIFVWGKIKSIDLDYTIRKTRNFPLIIIIAIYALGTIILSLISANIYTSSLMLCYALNTAIVFLINLKWKISIHSMGVAGPTMALIFSFGFIGIILGFFGPLVMWSRLILNKHTKLQVLLGSWIGYLLIVFEFAYLLFLDNIVINWFVIIVSVSILMIISLLFVFFIRLNN